MNHALCMNHHAHSMYTLINNYHPYKKACAAKMSCLHKIISNKFQYKREDTEVEK